MGSSSQINAHTSKIHILACYSTRAPTSYLFRQYERMQRSARLEAISQTKLELAEQEQKLFFFDNRDRYEMEKEEKVKQWVRTLPRTDWNMVGCITSLRWKPPIISVRLDFLKCVQIFIFFKSQFSTHRPEQIFSSVFRLAFWIKIEF